MIILEEIKKVNRSYTTITLEPLNFFNVNQLGTGLGMATVKNIVEAHGGEITFETKADQGTKFTISIPIKANS